MYENLRMYLYTVLGKKVTFNLSILVRAIIIYIYDEVIKYAMHQINKASKQIMTT